MSEYIEIDSEISEDGNQLYIYTNLRLAERGDESYDSVAAMAEGSAVAQALAMVPGIRRLDIEAQELTIEVDPETSWHAVVADVSAVLKDFFL